ncbi:PREDICTED: uncharacterized protein LOC106323647 [Brassica oleracea var. oleracea]|uniref:uncharacterized protein LOC106323647 n=1 Tax=Brassica oleracea var. oleracea TaxID=109376 RepID=UPI0006A73223|nr:PREDICTED: uncharacterized protein LOC106323647 [Brassica oleracea var. oleracea]
MALAVVEAARKLRPYFQSHSVEVLTDQPLRTILQNTNRSGRLTKWAIELGELDITYKNRTGANSNWTLHVDGSSTNKGAGAGVQLQSPTGELISQSFSFGFPASNNEAEYESLIAGLRLAKAVKAKRLSAYCDSQLVASQFSGDYEARNDRKDAYLKIVQSLTAEFEFFELIKVPRGENVCADALAAVGSKLRDQVKRTIPIHRIEKPSIDIPNDQTLVAPVIEPTTPDDDRFGPDWRTEFIDYLSKGELPNDKWEARRLKTRSAHYVVLDDELHRWTASKLLLKCIHGDETVRVMAETHEGAGGNHSGGRALAIKVRSLGFFWPTMNADYCESYARSCDKCQRHAPSIHCPTEMLRTTTAPYPFMRWAMDIIGPLPCSRQRRFILVLTDYFTKWIEAEAYAQVTDKEFRGNFKEFCGKWNIRLSPSTPRYPQGSTKSTPFSLAYGVEAMYPAEVNVSSLRRSKMPQYVELNKEMLLDALDEIEERRDQALLCIQNYQHQIES